MMTTALLAAAMIVPQQTSPSANPADAGIHALLDAQTAAWNHNDASAWAKDFTDDADFINIRGDVVHGRTGVEKLHAFIFSGPYKNSHSEVTIESIKYPSPEIAVVETLHEVSHFYGLPPGVVETAPGVLRTRMKYILVLRENTWRIFSAQNTAVLPAAIKPR